MKDSAKVFLVFWIMLAVLWMVSAPIITTGGIQ